MFTIICKNCGNEIGPDKLFCGKCGAKVERVLTCPNCGAELSEGTDFCGKCGYRVGRSQNQTESRQTVGGKPQTQKKGGKKWIAILIACVVAAAVLAIFLLMPGFNNPTEDIKVYPVEQGSIAQAPESGVQYVANQLIVSFDGHAKRDEIERIVAEKGGEIVGYIEKLNIFQVQIKQPSTYAELNQIQDELEKNPLVTGVSFNTVDSPSSVTEPVDPWKEGYKAGDQIYDESNPGGSNWGLEAIKAPAAWKYNDQMTTAKIGVVDSGFYLDRSDLDIPTDFSHASGVDGKYSSLNINDNLHGTFVLGIIGAIQDNDKGIAGVMRNHDLYVYRTDGQAFSVMCGIFHLISSEGVKIINLSMGNSYTNDQAKELAGKDEQQINNFVNDSKKTWIPFLKSLKANESTSNFLIIQAAGNNDIDARWTGSFCDIDESEFKSNILIVGGCILSNGQYIKSDISDYGTQVDVTAPGENIHSIVWPNILSLSNTGDGTSFAAPFVTGTAGLIAGVNPNLSCSQIRQIILDTSNEAFTYNGMTYNIPDAGAAVKKALELKANGSATSTREETEETQDRGISNSNAANGGGMTEDKDYIYYTLSYQFVEKNLYSNELYATDKNTGAAIDLKKNAVFDLNAYRGKLYCFTNTDDTNEEILVGTVGSGGINNWETIYRTKNTNEVHHNIHGMIVYGNSLYWIEKTYDYNTEKGKNAICKSSLDGKNEAQIYQTDGDIFSMNVEDDTVYYCEMVGMDYQYNIGKVKTDGTGQEFIIKGLLCQDNDYWDNIIAYQGKIYYMMRTSQTVNSYDLMAYDIATHKSGKVISNIPVCFSIYNGRIYYVKNTDTTDDGYNSLKLVSTDLSGNGLKEIASLPDIWYCTSIYTAENKIAIYCLGKTADTAFTYYMMNMDGSIVQKIATYSDAD